jgi:hypothetical protein
MEIKINNTIVETNDGHTISQVVRNVLLNAYMVLKSDGYAMIRLGHFSFKLTHIDDSELCDDVSIYLYDATLPFVSHMRNQKPYASAKLESALDRWYCKCWGYYN